MDIIDFIEAWWLSVRVFLEPAGIAGQFKHSPNDRINRSGSLNLRRGKQEVDLLVWASGEAELSLVRPDGSVYQQHFDDLRKQPDLGMVLSHLSAIALAR